MKGKVILLSVLLICLLFAFARAVPSATVTEEAQSRYLDEGLDDEYEFL